MTRAEVTRRIRADPPGLRILNLDLIVVDGPSRGLKVSVGDGFARVGTAPGSHLRVEDTSVSRVHCEIRVRPGAIVIKDCGSTNGTHVADVRVREAVLQPGAVVHIGDTAFRIEAAGGQSSVEISDHTSFGELFGSSLDMRQVYAILERIAPTTATLLVEGETGTGKDVVARSLHARSARADGPFVPVDCGAIPESLIESELFGHVRGAFSGAVSDRKGVFEEACGGTLFLDEIGEMPVTVQAKLLRAIETRSIRRVGSNAERQVDVRLVAATNRSLTDCVNQGAFREDLYYRLAVVEVKLPALRSRREDIPLLAQRFYAELGGTDAVLPAAFVAMLQARSWPGNVRELRNFIERSVSLGFIDEPPDSHRHAFKQPETIPPAALEGIVPLHLPLKDARQVWTENFENIYVVSMLKKTDGNLTRAAELAGVNRRFLQRLVARLGLRAKVSAEPEED